MKQSFPDFLIKFLKSSKKCSRYLFLLLEVEFDVFTLPMVLNQNVEQHTNVFSELNSFFGKDEEFTGFKEEVWFIEGIVVKEFLATTQSVLVREELLVDWSDFLEVHAFWQNYWFVFSLILLNFEFIFKLKSDGGFIWFFSYDI